ncbi:TonB family protein [Lichenihabitans sp. Uapishka_5]|uniref:energy transducer TonB n=1 Tax=Lichenihabitans sp. Uapishka_5 TaxID=3037302 RepID=UPI0029E7E2C7|nr:TonB family protein [Lichenihabitans sp. Uapishka_5]MDX7951883.1 TonB family protein [Lichenihabitans sp. Uapishka_5]
MQSPDILDLVPEHVADPARRAPWRRRLGTALGTGAVSVLLNGAVVGGMIAVGWPLRITEAPRAVSVELVDHMPGEPKGPGGGPAPKPGDVASKPEVTTPATAALNSASQAEVVPASPRAEPLKPEAPSAPEAAPPQQEVPTQQAPAQEAPAPDPVAAPLPAVASAPPGELETHPAATPASPEHPDNTAQPRLVAVPTVPEGAADQPIATAPPAIATAAPSEAVPTPSPAQRPVIANAAGNDPVPTPSPPPDVPKPPTAEQQRQAATTAKLAALFPYGTDITADPAQAPPSPAEGGSTAYRGRVYANFNKAADVIADARARHLKGQTVVAFTVDQRGDIASLAVAVSSGNPAVDAAALELIRHSSPFPPPPPGAPRSFSPAIGLGMDE